MIIKELYGKDAERMAGNIIRAADDAKKSGKKVLVFLHKSVDGDCVGSSCALVSVLRLLGADSYVASPEEFPHNMSFLGVDDLVLHHEDIKGISGDDFTAISVDCTESTRMGICGEIFARKEETLSIDHHEVIGLRDELKWIEPEASSACEMVFYVSIKIAELLNRPVSEILDRRAAACLMAGIVTDTGRFTYTNTRPETLEAAGELMELGGDITEVCYNLFDRKKREEFLVSNNACIETEFFCGGKFAMSVVPLEMFRRFGATSDDVSDVVSRLRDIDGVELAIVLRETEEHRVRANLRSKSFFDCSVFATQYNGGGHKKAAGFTVEGKDIFDIRKDVLERVEKLL